MGDRELLRCALNQQAELYQKAGPIYPEALFHDLFSLAGLRAGVRVVEVGGGSGRPTRPVGRRGRHVIRVELGECLAAVGRRKLREFRVQWLQIGFSAGTGWLTHRLLFKVKPAKRRVHEIFVDGLS